MYSRRRVLFVVNGYPSESRPWKCPFNHRAIHGILPFLDASVLTFRTWHPGMHSCSYYYKDVFVQELLIPPFPLSSELLIKSKNIYSSINSLAVKSAVKKISRQISDVDIIHSVAIGFHSIAAQHVASEHNVPHVVQLIGSDVNKLLPKLYQSNVFNGFIENVSAFIANSQSLAHDFMDICGNANNIHTIYRGVDLLKNTPVRSIEQKVKSKVFKFLYLGGLVNDPYYRPGKYVKGADLLLRAWMILEKMFPDNTQLVIGGPGNHKKGIENYFADLKYPERVKYVGAITSDQVPDLLRNSDALIIPSYKEGLPNLCLESMACGTPVVASSVGGIPEVIQHNVDGLLFKSGDIDGLVQFMKQMFYDDDARCNMSLNARKKVVSLFDNKYYGKLLYEVYERIFRSIV